MAASSLSAEASAILTKARSAPLCDRHVSGTALDRSEIEALLPQRDPLLLLDTVVHVDHDRGLLCARYDLARAGSLLTGHFPDDPVFPGVLQVEAIGQAGALLHALRGADPDTGANATSETALLVRILCARFGHRVHGTGTLEITVLVVDDGFLFTTVGQTVHGGRVCAAAAVSSVVDD